MNTRVSIIRKYYYKVSLCILGIAFLALSGCRWKNQNTETEADCSEPIKPDSNAIAVKDTSSIFKDSIANKKADTIKAVSKKKNTFKNPGPVCDYGVMPVEYKTINDPDTTPL